MNNYIKHATLGISIFVYTLSGCATEPAEKMNADREPVATKTAIPNLNEWQAIAVVTEDQAVTEKRLAEVLQEHDVPSTAEGSIVHWLSVPTGKADLAREILRTSGKIDGIKFELIE